MAELVTYTELGPDGEVYVQTHDAYFAEEQDGGVLIRESLHLAEIDDDGEVWIFTAVTLTPPDSPSAQAVYRKSASLSGVKAAASGARVSPGGSTADAHTSGSAAGYSVAGSSSLIEREA